MMFSIKCLYVRFKLIYSNCFDFYIFSFDLCNFSKYSMWGHIRVQCFLARKLTLIEFLLSLMLWVTGNILIASIFYRSSFAFGLNMLGKEGTKTGQFGSVVCEDSKKLTFNVIIWKVYFLCSNQTTLDWKTLLFQLTGFMMAINCYCRRDLEFFPYVSRLIVPNRDRRALPFKAHYLVCGEKRRNPKCLLWPLSFEYFLNV